MMIPHSPGEAAKYLSRRLEAPAAKAYNPGMLPSPIPPTLNRQWWATAGVYLLALAGGYVVVTSGGIAAPGRWLALSAVTLTGQLLLLRRSLNEHQDAHGQVWPTLGWGNALTLTRGLCLGLLAGFLLSPWPMAWLAWGPAVLYTSASLIDIVDGVVARRSGFVSRLGSILDLELDALGVLLANVLGVLYEQVPAWYLVIGLARYVYVAGLWLRTQMGRPVYPIPPSMNRRSTAGFQMGLLGAVLWPITAPPATTIAALMLGLPTLAIFGRDWLVATGYLDPQTPTYARRRERWLRLVKGWLPLAARLGALGLLLNGALSLPGDGLGLLGWSGLALLISGALGRLGGLLLLFYIGLSAPGGPYPLAHLWLLPCALWPLSQGSGYLAAWQPEESFFNQRLGSRRVRPASPGRSADAPP